MTEKKKQLFLLVQQHAGLRFKELLVYSWLVWKARYGLAATMYQIRKELGGHLTTLTVGV